MRALTLLAVILIVLACGLLSCGKKAEEKTTTVPVVPVASTPDVPMSEQTDAESPDEPVAAEADISEAEFAELREWIEEGRWAEPDSGWSDEELAEQEDKMRRWLGLMKPLREAAKSLAPRVSADEIPELVEKLHSDVNAKLQTSAFLTLVEIGKPAVPALGRAFSATDRRARIAAATALGYIGEPSAVPALVECTGDEDEGVRAAAATALGFIGEPSAIPALEKLLDDEVEDVRWIAAWTLGDIGDASAIPALEKLLHDGDEKVREAAEDAIADIRARKADD